MNALTLTCLLGVLVVCNFCGDDFKVLGRHSWRCKKRFSSNNNDGNHGNESSVVDNVSNVNVNVNDPNDPSNTYIIKCICGKPCKGLKGLKAHQRSCRTVVTLSDESNYAIKDNTHVNESVIQETLSNMQQTQLDPSLKEGVNLPKTEEDWVLANSFFHSELSHTDFKNVNSALDFMNETVYNYFRDNYGYKSGLSEEDIELRDKYKSFSNKELKAELKHLKSSNAPIKHIRYVSKSLRSKISKKSVDITVSSDNDLEISKSFWGYAKKVLQSSPEVLPQFNKDTCTKYFRKVLKCLNPLKVFIIPDWIPPFEKPKSQFNLSSPSYREITKIIKRMKTSGSPCPLDQISIICLKRCPYLRSFMTSLCCEVFNTKTYPSAWKKAATILIYKKGDPSLPENFRPITLEPVTLKIFTSLLRNRVYEFLLKNGYIEKHYQKGFTPGVSGTFEHIAEMTNIINHARNKQMSVTITLIDLRNAFGEVNHQLIRTVFKYHHVPEEICDLVSILYTDFNIAIITKKFITCYIPVGKGVLQGDSFSPLIFNMLVNTFVQCISAEQYTNFGYRAFKNFVPRNWFQFADDAASVTSLEYENQILLNVFSRWCRWADMIVRVDKCHSFGIKKKGTLSVQFKPKLYIDNQLIPPIDYDKPFTYLGRYFDFKMSDNQHQTEIIDTITDHLEKINQLPLHPRNKILLYQRVVLSKISWHLTVTHISNTWVKNNVDNIVSKYIRLWLEIPISGTLSIITQTKSKFGLGIVLPSARHVQCQVTYRNKLRNSKSEITREIHNETKSVNMQYDQYLTTKDAITKLRKLDENRVNTELTTQSLVIKSIWDLADPRFTSQWTNVLQILPSNIYSFVNRYLSNSLANGTNAVKWGITNISTCLFCSEKQTLGHVIGGCAIALQQKRYNWRHDSVLLNIIKSLSPLNGAEIFCDIEGYKNPSIITGLAERPDLLLKKGSKLLILELTVGFETNLLNNYNRKKERYERLLNELSNTYEIIYTNLSMGAIGVICKNSNLCRGLESFELNKESINFIVKRIANVCIRASYYIFCSRNREWTNPDLMCW